MAVHNSDVWARAVEGDLDALEEGLANATTVQLATGGSVFSGQEVCAALAQLRSTMLDISVTGRIDRCEGAAVVWLDLSNLPWLPEETIRSVLRITGSVVEVLGGLEQLLEQGFRSPDADSAAIAPSALHPNALILRAGYDDPPIHATIFTDGFVAHTPGRNPVAGDWQGADPMAEHLGRIRELSGDTMSVRPLTRFALANDGFGVVFSRATASRGSEKLDQYVCGVWRFDQGRIAEHWELVSDPEAWDTFWNLKTVT